MARITAADLAFARQQIASLRSVIESLSDGLALEPLLTRMLGSAVSLLGAGHGAIGLLVQTASGPAVRISTVYNLSPTAVGTVRPLGVGLAGRVLSEGRAVRLARYGELDQPVRPDLLDHAVLGVPIVWADRPIGFFGVGAPPPRRFTDVDVETLTLFARYAAIAITNARLFEAERWRTARLATINRVGSLLTRSLSLDQLLQTAVEAISDHLHFANVAILLVDPDEPEYLVLRARGGMHGSMVNEYRQHRSQGIVGAAATSMRRVLVNNVQEDPRSLAIPGGEGIVAELAVPVRVGDQLHGVLNVESEDPISEEDADSLVTIADQLGIALEHVRLFERTQAALEETRLLYETSRRMSTAADMDEVVRAYLEQVAARGHYACTVALYEPDEMGGPGWVVVCGRWAPDSGITFSVERIPRTHDALDPVLDAGQTATIIDVDTDPRVTEVLRVHQRESGRPALAMIPLIVHGQRIGLVILSSPLVQEWSATDLRPYQVTAGQLAAALDSRRQQLLAAEHSRRLAVLEERRRLAHELHDVVTQSVFTVTLIAQSLASAWRRDPTEGERRVERLLSLSQSALAELRALLAELRPAEPASPESEMRMTEPSRVRVRRDGLVGTLRALVADCARDGLRVTLDVAGYRPQSLEQEEALFRISQEALNNVVKHARARTASVRLALDSGWVRLTVRDDGVGFHEATDGAHRGVLSRGYGLIGIRERAAALSGAAHIISAPGRGTVVDVVLPRKGEPM